MADIKEVIYGDRDGGYDYGYGNNGWNGIGGGIIGGLVGGGLGAAFVSVWDKMGDTRAAVESVKADVREAQAGVYRDIAAATEATNARVDGTSREVLNNRFTTERGLCDLGYRINNDIRDAKDASLAADQNIMDRLCTMASNAQACCCETNLNIERTKNQLSLEIERGFCATNSRIDQIACLIKDQAKDNEIAALRGKIDDIRQGQLLSAIYTRTTPATASAATPTT